ncbi:MAG: Dipeptidyl aminopeptidase 4 [Verrucomicrobiota bacterium]
MRGIFPGPTISLKPVAFQGVSAVLRRFGRPLAAFGMLASVLAQPLPGTAELTGAPDQDRAADMVDGLRTYLDRTAAQSAGGRDRIWRNPSDSSGRFESNRTRLRAILGLQDPRDERAKVSLRHVIPSATAVPPASAEIGRGRGYRIFPATWTVFRGVEGEGLLLVPDGTARADVIAVPDCEWTPEQFVGLTPGLGASEQLARLCAEQGCRVLVPSLIGRDSTFAGNPGVRSTRHSQRETLWRAGYEMGHTPITYDLHKILAAADWLQATRPTNATAPASTHPPALALVGYGEGGLLALYAAAADTRFTAAWVGGYFGPRERLWEEPLDRNLFGLLKEFGDAEIAALVAPRPLFLEAGRYPERILTDEHGGSPGRLGRPEPAAVVAEHERLKQIVGTAAGQLQMSPPEIVGASLGSFLATVAGAGSGAAADSVPDPARTGTLPDPADRTLRQYRQILEDTQWLMGEGEYVRREFWKTADLKSLAAFTNSATVYRSYFHSNVVGILPPASLPPNPRTRLLGETNGVRRYEVLLEVHRDVMAYGILCVPADLKPGERRPVVVCQHGLEGRPADISDPTINSPYYHQYGLRLAERGFITFAPQNPYIGVTKFRQVLHRAQPLGLTLWSFIVRQHEVITDWLAAQPFVDPQRIAFYGLSYGGKTAMRVPVLVDRYCLSICSADYNEWIWKNVSSRSPYSYLWTSEYDMPEWNMGNTFNYAELSWLILPRPFMVERGHDDGVAPDEWVAYEYAKTRRHYVKLGLADRTEIEFFDGPHSIHGVGTFDFLHRHLNWPKTGE